jgi:hypothetical protein
VRFGAQTFDIDKLDAVDDETQQITITVPLLEGHAGGQQIVVVNLVVLVGQNQSAPFVIQVFNPS